MKRYLLYVAFCCVALAPLYAGADEIPLRILFIGNSFTYYNEGLDYNLWLLAASAGITIQPDSVTHGGWTLSQHSASPETIATIRHGNWDVVVLQEYGATPIYDKQAFFDAATALNEEIRASGARTVLFMTWPYEGQPEMTKPLAAAYNEIGAILDAPVTPVGIAWQWILDHSAMDLYYPDDHHPSNNGTYLATCMFFTFLTGESPVGLTYRLEGIYPADALFIQEVAWDMMKSLDAVLAAGVGEKDGDSREDFILLKKENITDANLYLYSAPAAGDWTYWDAVAKNPSPLGRDLWVIPSGNSVVALAAFQADGGAKQIAVLKRDGSEDMNLYVYRDLEAGDWTYWDALARNPSPLARDFWSLPVGNDAIGLAAADISIPPDGRDELAILRERGAEDLDLYYYNAPVPGDWTYWDAFARNPSPLARDFWVMPGAGGAKDIAAIGEGGGEKKLGVLVQEGMGDANLYLYNNLVPGDWNYWDASSRNPSPAARDFWVIPSGNRPLTIAGIDSDGDGYDVLLPKRELYGARSLYLYNAPAQGDWTYWDAYSRNPSPLARDPRL